MIAEGETITTCCVCGKDVTGKTALDVIVGYYIFDSLPYCPKCWDRKRKGTDEKYRNIG